ncbi:hypothetical protein EIB71_10025 [Kaistella daneshvariae]|jgi:hypothetical protein|uniref:Uncharacterized protein n=1 Tax=Kaistella daneshvariae TaxID=2487074 RepID=A0A3N0WZR2_9FLAO|nr:hypothetical protein [Kaistella daneshvariae]AZI67981.1 hypothetical protein EIB71_10025 [Kaistella daneshvariae]ROI10590.1 hypothetical protein EGI11_01445 [Kaistella daneshvariae]
MIDSPYFPYAFALLLALPFLIYMRQFVYTSIQLKKQQINLMTVKGQSEQRIHAYERITLFLERLKPANLVSKFDESLATHEYLFLLEKSINEEFDYNASQQLYLTKNSWNKVVNCKNNILHLLHKTYENLSNESTLQDFKTVFLMNYMNEQDYISATIEDLRKENLIVN